MTTQAIVPGELRSFIKDYADDYYALRLIFFFAAYPNTRFSSRAMFGALGLTGNYQSLGRALTKLVENRVLDVSSGNAIPLYRLGDDSGTRSSVIELRKLDSGQKSELLSLTRV